MVDIVGIAVDIVDITVDIVDIAVDIAVGIVHLNAATVVSVLVWPVRPPRRVNSTLMSRPSFCLR